MAKARGREAKNRENFENLTPVLLPDLFLVTRDFVFASSGQRIFNEHFAENFRLL